MPNSAKWHSSKTQVLCGFEPNSAISLSQAAQCLGTQVANAALGRRGFLRAAGKRPALGSVAGPGGFSLCPA